MPVCFNSLQPKASFWSTAFSRCPKVNGISDIKDHTLIIQNITTDFASKLKDGFSMTTNPTSTWLLKSHATPIHVSSCTMCIKLWSSTKPPVFEASTFDKDQHISEQKQNCYITHTCTR